MVSKPDLSGRPLTGPTGELGGFFLRHVLTFLDAFEVVFTSSVMLGASVRPLDLFVWISMPLDSAGCVLDVFTWVTPLNIARMHFRASTACACIHSAIRLLLRILTPLGCLQCLRIQLRDSCCQLSGQLASSRLQPFEETGAVRPTLQVFLLPQVGRFSWCLCPGSQPQAPPRANFTNKSTLA